MTDRMEQEVTLEVGIIGFGNRARLGQLVDAHPGARVVAVCDRDPDALARAATIHPGALMTPDLETLLASGVDAVMVLTPDDTHEAVAVAALERGIAVFCEKPLAITAAGSDRILRAAVSSGARLYVGHNMRHLPMVRTVRSLIADGAIGEVKAIWCRHFVGHGADFYFKDWHADRARTTGLLLQKGAHDIDVIHWLAGASTRRVTAMGALTLFGSGERSGRDDQRATEVAEPELWPPQAHSRLHPTIDVEDLSMALFELENGVLASYEQCHYTPDYWRSYTVIGTHGRLENVGDMDDGEIHVWNRRHAGFAAPDEIHGFTGGVSDHGGADEALVDEFIRYARDGGPTQTSPIAARDAVAAGEAATISLRAGGVPQDVPPAPATLRAALEGNRER
ncbi:Gfo/Idh/MocA family protein [Microbacterium sp.]|mgnify:FL=1|uniref:Gfo/Idh/MocA family protein n=1 Tax=Microbacterium sp. TaxID=51671 RepID=UPI000A5C4B25|nr:Gfo/Idh/MocA family oxidoreductase [Microbacterium sp.]